MILDTAPPSRYVYARSDSGPGYKHGAMTPSYTASCLDAARPSALGSSTTDIPKTLSWPLEVEKRCSVPTSPEEQQGIIMSLQQPMKSLYAASDQIKRHPIAHETIQSQYRAPDSMTSYYSAPRPQQGPTRRDPSQPKREALASQLESDSFSTPMQQEGTVTFFDPIKDVVHPMRYPGNEADAHRVQPQWGGTAQRQSTPLEVHVRPRDMPQDTRPDIPPGYQTRSTDRLLENEPMRMKSAYI